jgi:hypothetical protein
MQKLLYARAQRLHQLLRALPRIGCEIDYAIRAQFSDFRAKAARGFLGGAVEHHGFDPLPGGVGHVRLLQTTAHTQNAMPGFDQPGR